MAKQKKAEENLKGTMVALLGLLVVVIAFWAACFNLFVDRF